MLRLNKHFKFLLCIALPIFAVLLTGDLISKHFIDAAIPLGEQTKFLPGFIDIITVHNEGAAWGMFAGNQIFLIIITFLFIAALVWFALYERTTNPLFHIAVGFVLAGCIGNLIDRLAFGYVRDFLHFEFWSTFPVFNIADICLCVGVVLFVIYFIILLVKNQKKKREKAVDEDIKN